jgi:phospholipid transport system substrate-binding protein
MHHPRKIRSFGSLGILLLALLPAAWAGPAEDARAALGAGIDEVSAALRDRPAQDNLIALLDTLADKHFAFETTTRLAVGPGWREFTPEQRTQATSLFSRLVIRTYADRIDGAKPPEIAFGTPAELRANRVEVPSRVVADGQTYAVTYRLELDKDENRWRIYDVVAEGVSLVSNYRSQFDPIVRRDGAKGLLAALENQLANVAAR